MPPHALLMGDCDRALQAQSRGTRYAIWCVAVVSGNGVSMALDNRGPKAGDQLVFTNMRVRHGGMPQELEGFRCSGDGR
jgi:hypothetical protein